MLLLSLCNNKLHVYSIHELLYKTELKNNFYLKDKNRSFENLKGKWIWENDNESLILGFNPNYKKVYTRKFTKHNNAYYDDSDIKIKYIKNDSTIYNNLNNGLSENCIKVKNFKIYTNLFFLKNNCNENHDLSYMALMNNFKSLCIINPSTDNRNFILFETEDGTEIVILNSIILDRVVN